jgi:hypothetical protein
MDEIVKIENIQNRIFTIRNTQVMLDSDLAELYQVETRVLNQAVKRNIKRFPEEFRFQLLLEEWNFLKSQFVTSNSTHGGKRKLPYVFTEQGVAMLSAVLRSDIAVKVSIQIMQAFIKMKKFISTNAVIFQRLENIEKKQVITDEKFDRIFKALEDKLLPPKQGIFYNGQIFDAYTLIADIIRSAKKSIILIDNYVDDTVLKQLAKRDEKVTATIFTKTINEILKQDIDKHNNQYPKIELRKLNTAHDRFLIIDRKTVYHFGASLKDAGKKWFAFSKLEMDAEDIIEKLQT